MTGCAGTFNNRAAATRCEPCAVGKYAPGLASVLCTPCPPRRTTLRRDPDYADVVFNETTGAAAATACMCQPGTVTDRDERRVSFLAGTGYVRARALYAFHVWASCAPLFVT